ncbi:uncharacterized protein LOC118438898 [Folsomia candida]|uniref:Lysosomal-associated transmembrane protein 4A n=1 Tax=Folsomia candida TaxID=158441 RepID=A0A226D9W3_FOLCA|nr:uncharacterized protein LOC118438898 [Folsomia candida]OXA41930.1 hypothetical protein Fcan01_23091 [Folsomia candida]
MSTETCCCGCCSVGQGTLAIGIFNIVGCILFIIFNSLAVNLMVIHPDQITDPAFYENPSRYITLGYVHISFSAIYFLLACLLVHGCHKRNHRFILPWLYWNYVSLLLIAVGMTAFFISLAISGEIGGGLILLGVYAAFFGIQMYLVFVVKHFVDELVVEDLCTARV